MLVVDCDYQSSDMRAVEQPARWVASEPQKAAFSDGSVQQNAGDGNMQGSPLDMRYSGIAPAYCAPLKMLSSFSLNAAISRPILSLVIWA